MSSAPYRIEFTTAAVRELSRLPKEVQNRLRVKIDALALEPRPSGVQKMAGRERRYRLRVGDYRVIYEIQDRVLVVVIIRIGHRREVYRRG